MGTVRTVLSMLRSPRCGFWPTVPSVPSLVPPDAGCLHIPQPDRDLLRAKGEKMLRASRATAEPLTLVVMQVYDLPEVELVFGRAAAEEVVDAVLTELTRTAGGRGFVVRSDADTFALLMPGSGAQATAAAIVARFGKPCVIEFELDDDEILLVPDARVHAFEANESVEQVYDSLCGAIARTRGQEAPRRECLARCESDTLPMRLSSSATRQPDRPECYPVLPPTIPVPMGAR